MYLYDLGRPTTFPLASTKMEFVALREIHPQSLLHSAPPQLFYEINKQILCSEAVLNSFSHIDLKIIFEVIMGNSNRRLRLGSQVVA